MSDPKVEEKVQKMKANAGATKKAMGVIRKSVSLPEETYELARSIAMVFGKPEVGFSTAEEFMAWAITSKAEEIKAKGRVVA